MTFVPGAQAEVSTCWWHPDRQTRLSCVRCGRSACPDCLREAAVGFQCIDCAQVARRQRRAAEQQQNQAVPLAEGGRTIAGARLVKTAILTRLLIAVNVVIFAITAVQSQSLLDNRSSSLFQFGVQRALDVSAGQWWRLLSSGFLHYGVLHLAVNMLALWLTGRELERILGRIRFTAVYLLSLSGGAVAVYLLDDLGVRGVGDSGAIYGLFGGLLVAALKLKIDPAPIIFTILLNIALSLAIPGISLLDHLGGLVIGVLLTAAIIYAPTALKAFWQSVVVLMVVAALIGLTMTRNEQIKQASCIDNGQTIECERAV